MRLPKQSHRIGLTLFLASSVLCFVTPPIWCEDQNVSDEFSRIYSEGRWGRNSAGEGSSGVGSVYAYVRPYMKMLRHFLRKHHIRSVVDIGCGDWELSRHIDWKNIHYYGYDVAAKVVQRNKEKYETKNIRFYCQDGIHSKLPKADLLICKDVLQHLPNSFVFDFLKKTKRFKYCLVTNDVTYGSANGWIPNQDIPAGQWRCVELAKPPFNVKGKIILIFNTINITKEVFLISR
jgi:SAM-dependent methyltransferase